jgi:hypothetical protein
VYEGICGDESVSWTEDAVAAQSTSREGLIEVLQMILKDVQFFPVLDVTEGGE